MSDAVSNGGKVERVTLTLGPEQRARLVREAAARSIVAGRPVSVSSVARDLIERALPARKAEAA